MFNYFIWLLHINVCSLLYNQIGRLPSEISYDSNVSNDICCLIAYKVK